jgi:hypothetical protein
MFNLGNFSPDFFVNMATVVGFVAGVLLGYFFFIASESMKLFKRDVFPLILAIVIVFFSTIFVRELLLNSNYVKNLLSDASLSQIIETEQQRDIYETQRICVQRLIKNGSLNKNNNKEYKLAKEACLSKNSNK